MGSNFTRDWLVGSNFTRDSSENDHSAVVLCMTLLLSLPAVIGLKCCVGTTASLLPAQTAENLIPPPCLPSSKSRLTSQTSVRRVGRSRSTSRGSCHTTLRPISAISANSTPSSPSCTVWCDRLVLEGVSCDPHVIHMQCASVDVSGHMILCSSCVSSHVMYV